MADPWVAEEDEQSDPWTPATPEPSFGQQVVGGVVGGVEALARGATFGLSDRASDAIQGAIRPGAYAEQRDQAAQEREQRAEQLGGLGTGLEVTGAVLPALLSRGKSAGASMAQLAPSALAVSAGEAVAEQMLGKFGAGVIGKLARTAFGTGVAGAIQGAVQELSDQIPQFQEDPAGAAEAILWEAGKGALLGAGVGGALGAAAQLARKTLKLGGAAVESIADAVGKEAPVAAARRAVAAVARGGRLGPELERAGGAEAVGRILLEEGVPLVSATGSADDVARMLRERATAASQAVLDAEGAAAVGGDRAVLAAAARREQALLYARDLAEEAVRSAPDRATGAAGSALAGAVGGALMGGGPGAIAGAAVGKLARGAVAERMSGIEALAFDQLAQLTARRGALVDAADRVAGSIEGIARMAGRATTQAGVSALRGRDLGPELDEQIGQSAALLQAGSPPRRALESEAEHLDQAEPGLGQAYMQGALKRAELMAEGFGERAVALYSQPRQVDDLTRMRLARRAIALQDPEAALTRIARGNDSSEDAHVMQQLYPGIWQKFTIALAQRMADKPLDYRAQVELGVRTGIQTVESLAPAALLSAQESAMASGQAQADQEAAAQRSAPKFGAKPNALERYGDKADRLAARGSQ